MSGECGCTISGDEHHCAVQRDKACQHAGTYCKKLTELNPMYKRLAETYDKKNAAKPKHDLMKEKIGGTGEKTKGEGA